MEQVYLQCVQDGRRLRVRITSPGYDTEANCQFPRAIREAGKRYSVPPSAISFARGPAGKFFYRVKKNDITIVEAQSEPQQVTVDRVYGDEETECLVCMAADREVVIVPCGHYCMCATCAGIIHAQTGKWPICRGNVNLIVTRDQIQV